jgi:hypothetical protein
MSRVFRSLWGQAEIAANPELGISTNLGWTRDTSTSFSLKRGELQRRVLVSGGDSDSVPVTGMDVIDVFTKGVWVAPES